MRLNVSSASWHLAMAISGPLCAGISHMFSHHGAMNHWKCLIFGVWLNPELIVGAWFFKNLLRFLRFCSD